jgi:hypothetical protein
MRRLALAAAAAAALVSTPVVAAAGVYTDDMAKCLVRSATPDDNKALVLWAFGAMSANPVVKPLSNVTEAQRAQFGQAAVKSIERLMLQDCRKESLMAVKIDGQSAIEGSFSLLGQVAFRNLMTDPGTMAEVGRLTSYVDQAKWRAFMVEAGVPTPQLASPKPGD